MNNSLKLLGVSFVLILLNFIMSGLSFNEYLILVAYKWSYLLGYAISVSIPFLIAISVVMLIVSFFRK